MLLDDTFSRIMFHEVFSEPWLAGFFAFATQMIFAALILNSQIKESYMSTPFSIPFKVDAQVRVGQFLAIPLCTFLGNEF